MSYPLHWEINWSTQWKNVECTQHSLFNKLPHDTKRNEDVGADFLSQCLSNPNINSQTERYSQDNQLSVQTR